MVHYAMFTYLPDELSRGLTLMAIASERFIMLLNLFKVASDLNQGEGDLTRRPSQILACLMVKDNFYKSVINFQNLSCPLKCIPLEYELISSSIGRIRWSTQFVSACTWWA